MKVPRSQAGHERRHSARVMCTRLIAFSEDLRAALVQRGVERLADREQADRDQHHLQPVEELGHAAGVAHLAADLVQPDQPDREADDQRGDAAQRALAEHRGDGGEGQQHQHEVLGRAELHRVVRRPAARTA